MIFLYNCPWSNARLIQVDFQIPVQFYEWLDSPKFLPTVHLYITTLPWRNTLYWKLYSSKVYWLFFFLLWKYDILINYLQDKPTFWCKNSYEMTFLSLHTIIYFLPWACQLPPLSRNGKAWQDPDCVCRIEVKIIQNEKIAFYVLLKVRSEP